ncbi:unnamed protein product [Symbiodinium natans]|uniref:Uncharacterized protein n=1 Tax=Symbiodinium natans TaxID=878477 RepID=A0A812I9L1_9DINO|nr:unnamed protein product [Symbiodinium natans]
MFASWPLRLKGSGYHCLINISRSPSRSTQKGDDMRSLLMLMMRAVLVGSGRGRQKPNLPPLRHAVPSCRQADSVNKWFEQLPGGSAPTARNGHSAAWSDAADGMYVFGGSDSNGGGGLSALNDSHFYDRQANSWVLLVPGGSAPAARYDHSATWSGTADGMYVFGGYDSNTGGGALNDLHFYDRQALLVKKFQGEGKTKLGRPKEVVTNGVEWSSSTLHGVK